MSSPLPLCGVGWVGSIFKKLGGRRFYGVCTFLQATM